MRELMEKFLEILDEIIAWNELPDEIVERKREILSKVISKAYGDDIQEFLHNIVKTIAGDKFNANPYIGKKLNEYLKEVKGREKEVIEYIKNIIYR